MQEAASDLVKTEEDEIGEEHGGERRKEGGPALTEEVGDKEEGGAGGGVGTPEQGVGEVVGVDCTL